MACIFKSLDELRNIIKNKLAIILYDNPNPTQQEIVNAIKYITKSVGLVKIPNLQAIHEDDDLKRYAVKTDSGDFYTDAYLKSRVTHKSDKKFRLGKSKQKIRAIKDNPVNIQKRELGTKLHAISQQLGELYYAQKTGKTYPKTLSQIKHESEAGEYSIDERHIDILNSGVKKIIDDIFKKQETINPEIAPGIIFEAAVVNPVKDVAGTMDVIAVYSNATADIFDYKFLSGYNADVKGFGDNRQLIRTPYNTSKLENWKLQLSDYKKYVLELYKVKDVLTTQIIPVWIDLKFENGKPVKKLNKLLIGEDQNKFLKRIHATYSKTGVKEVDEFLTGRYKEIETLKMKLSRAEFSERPAIRERINRIHQSITNFIETQNIERLVDDVIKTIQPYYSKLIKGEKISYDELNDIIDYTKYLVDFEYNFTSNFQFIKNQNEVLANAIKQALNKKVDSEDSNINTLKEKIRDGISPILITFQEYRKQLILDQADVQSEEELIPEDFFTSTFLPMSEFRDKIVQFIQSKFTESYENIRQDLNNIVEEISKKDTEALKWLRSKGENANDLVKYLRNNAGNLVTELSNEFYELRNTARNKGDSLWFIQTHKIKDRNYLNETYTQWYNRAKKEQEELLKDQFDYLYKEDKDKYLDELRKGIDRWQAENDLSLNTDGTAQFPQAWIYSKWVVPKQSTKDEHISDQYKIIKENKPLLDYYNLILDLNEKYRQWLGYDTIDRNFLPKVRADILERAFNADGKGIIGELKEIFEIREDTQGFSMIDPVTGVIEKEIPIYFVNPFRDAEGNIDLASQSKDIRRSLILFAKMAHTYKYMSEIEATILAAKEVQSGLSYNKINAKGQKVFDFMHNLAKEDKAKGKSMIEQVIQNAIDYHLYGIKVQPFAGNPKLTNIILKAKRYLSLKVLGLSLIPAGAGYVAAGTQAWIEGKKGVIYNSKQWQNSIVLQATEFNKYHALSYFFGVHNEDLLQQINAGGTRLGDTIGDRTYREGIRKYINARTWLRPFSYLDERIDNHIAVSMAQNYGVDENGNLKRLQNLPQGYKSIWELFNYEKDNITFNVPEEHLRKVITQFKNAVRAGQRGIKGTMNEEDINHAQRNLILNLMMQFKTWMPGVINERFGKLKYNNILDAPQWGRYRGLWNEVEFKKDASIVVYLLRSAANLSLYIAKDFITFAPLFRSFGSGDIKVDETRAKLYYQQYKNNNPNTKLTYEEFLKVKKAAIRASLLELQIILIFVAILTSLGADWDDDGKPLYRDNILLHKIYQIVNRAQTELQFTLNPFEYAKVINNPFPIASLATDLAKLLNNTADEFTDTIFGEDVLDEFITGKNPRPDQAGKFYYTIGLICGARGLERTLNLSSQAEKQTR